MKKIVFLSILVILIVIQVSGIQIIPVSSGGSFGKILGKTILDLAITITTTESPFNILLNGLADNRTYELGSTVSITYFATQSNITNYDYEFGVEEGFNFTDPTERAKNITLAFDGDQDTYALFNTEPGHAYYNLSKNTSSKILRYNSMNVTISVAIDGTPTTGNSNIWCVNGSNSSNDFVLVDEFTYDDLGGDNVRGNRTFNISNQDCLNIHNDFVEILFKSVTGTTKLYEIWNVTYNHSIDTSSGSCLDIAYYGYGVNYSCSNYGETTVNISIPILYFDKFNTSSHSSLHTNSGEVSYLRGDNRSTFVNLSAIFTGSQATPVENLTVDIGNNGNKDFRLPGKLTDTYLEISKFTTDLTNELILFPSEGYSYLRYVDFPSDSRFLFNYLIKVTGSLYQGNITLNFSNTVYKDGTKTDSVWNTSMQALHLTTNIQPHITFSTVSGANPPSLSDYSTCDGTTLSSTLYCLFDQSQSTYTRFYYNDISTSSTDLGEFVVKGYSDSDTFNIIYSLECFATSTSPPSVSKTNFTVYDWTNSKWVEIDSCYTAGGTDSTGVLTATYSLSTYDYTNSSGMAKFRLENARISGWGAAEEYANVRLYYIGNTSNDAYNTLLWQNTTTLKIYTSSTNITNLTINTSINNFTSGQSIVYLSTDGVTYEQMPIQNEKYQHNFTQNGSNLYIKFKLKTDDITITPKVYKVELFDIIGEYPTNMSFDFGNDGTYDYIDDGVLNGAEVWNATLNFSSKYTNYYSSYCSNLGSVVGCVIPVKIKSGSSGYLDLAINFTTASGNHPINSQRPINVTDVKNSCNTNDCNIPINLTFKSGSGVTVSNVLLGYYGQGNVSISAHNLTSSDNNTMLAQFYYSNYNVTLPYGIQFIEFIPSSTKAKNVSAYGQSKTKPIFNVTMLNLGNNSMNFSMLINDTGTCVNLSYSYDTWNNGRTQMTKDTWYTIFSDRGYLNKTNVFLYASLDCNMTAWNLFNPEIYFRGCCKDCICDASVS